MYFGTFPSQLPAPFELALLAPSESVTMETRMRKFLDDRINILDGKVVHASPARQVFKTVSAILILTRVSLLSLVPPVGPHWWANQDEMIDNEDSVQLSEYCFNACVALETVIQGKGMDDVGGSVRTALKVLERCVRQL